MGVLVQTKLHNRFYLWSTIGSALNYHRVYLLSISMTIPLYGEAIVVVKTFQESSV